ncbi:hypothetical protein OSM02_25890, partial [Escherichia coli]|nr:hypothetical protein [Escherichia coli]
VYNVCGKSLFPASPGMNNDGTALVLTAISLSSLYDAVNVILPAYRTRLAFWYPPQTHYSRATT